MPIFDTCTFCLYNITQLGKPCPGTPLKHDHPKTPQGGATEKVRNYICWRRPNELIKKHCKVICAYEINAVLNRPRRNVGSPGQKNHMSMVWKKIHTTYTKPIPDCEVSIVLLSWHGVSPRKAAPSLHKPLKDQPVQSLHPPLQVGARRMSRRSLCKLRLAWHGLTLATALSAGLNSASRSRISPFKPTS